VSSTRILASGFSRYGSSNNGRSVMVSDQHQTMLDGFQQISKIPSSQSYHALVITSAVNSLRSSSSPVNSFAKNGSPTRRCIVFSGCEIEYELVNYHGGPQTDVHIVDIRFTGDDSQHAKRAALWRVSFDNASQDWGVFKGQAPERQLKGTDTVAGTISQPLEIGVNGFCDGFVHAAEILPAHITRGEAAAEDALKSVGYQLFYVPVEKNSTKAGWTFLRDMGRTAENKSNIQASRILAGHMKEAHDQGLYVEWTSHRGGSQVLIQAMKLLQRHRINVQGKQKIFLSDHTSSHFEADQARRAIGMDVRDSTWYNATPGIAQIMGGQSFGVASLACSIDGLLNHTKREEMPGKVVMVGGGVGAAAVATNKMAPVVAQLVSSFALTPAFAWAITAALGLSGVRLAASSVPSFNNKYHKGTKDVVAQLANKSFNKLVPPK